MQYERPSCAAIVRSMFWPTRQPDELAGAKIPYVTARRGSHRLARYLVLGAVLSPLLYMTARVITTSVSLTANGISVLQLFQTLICFKDNRGRIFRSSARLIYLRRLRVCAGLQLPHKTRTQSLQQLRHDWIIHPVVDGWAPGAAIGPNPITQ